MGSLLLGIIYLAFISLGLPDAVFGSAWPLMSEQFDVAISSMGIVTIIIALGTIISSLSCNRLTCKIGVYKLTTISVFLTTVGMLGFALSPNYTLLCLIAIPYGLGAGGVDAALNNYVAINYESKHLLWLHCMWGLGATAGPYIMGYALAMQHQTYRSGYLILFIIQLLLTIFLAFSKKAWIVKESKNETETSKALSIKEIFKIPGVIQVSLAFFCFCALESTTGMWATSFLVYQKGVHPDIAVKFGGLFYMGITIGRAFSGFLTIKFNDKQMIRGGSLIMFIGLIILLLPLNNNFALLGIILVGLGSSPVYPCIIHSTPHNFGVENAQAITGVQMASAYVGILIVPPIFGIIASHIAFGLYPMYILFILIGMIMMYEMMLKKVKK